MSVRVAAGAIEALLEHPDGFTIQVASADVETAAVGLARARGEIAALVTGSLDEPDGPNLSGVVLGPRGPLLRITRPGLHDELLGTVLDLVVAALGAHGLGDGLVDVPEPGGRLDALDRTAGAVVLRLFPAPSTAGALPPSWLDLACEWVLGDRSAGERVPVRLLALEYEVHVAEAPSIVHQAAAARAWCDVVNGQLTGRLRTSSITFGRAPHLALAAGGPGCDEAALLARFDLLVDVARELAADTAYACIDLEETFGAIGLGLPTSGWRSRGGASPNLVVGELGDVLVPDVFPYQILGKGHLARFPSTTTSSGGEPPVGERLSDERVEVLVGDPADWLPGSAARTDAQAEGFELLAPALADDREVAALIATKPRRQVQEGDGGSPVALGTTPDLDSITIEVLPHARRGLRLTLLELVSWLAHEPHSDTPATVSPVVATYARWFASGLDHDARQALKPLARRLVGSASALGHDPREIDRAWVAADWLARVQAPAWLRLAGLEEAAGRLESLAPVRSHLELVRAVEVLGSALIIAARRIDITGSIAGDDDPDAIASVESAAWEAWERAAESAGCVAAAEATSVGASADLVYATDLRVIECSRDGRARDELESRHTTVGDAAWVTALHAVAEQAWTAGWDAAAESVEETARVGLRIALDRALRAAGDRSGLEEDARDALLEQADDAARESLTRSALAKSPGPGDEHPWDKACAAARSAGEAGALWSLVHELARDAVEPEPWDAAMTAARNAAGRALRDAPDLVARIVVVSVARETCSAAARGVALRAAAVAQAEGAAPDEVAEAARQALAPAARRLQRAAVDLLERLL